jgi:hypothetical protein
MVPEGILIPENQDSDELDYGTTLRLGTKTSLVLNITESRLTFRNVESKILLCRNL